MPRLTSVQELSSIREGGKILAEVLEKAQELVVPGMETAYIDRVIEETIRAKGGTPAFKGYRGYPASSCISINEQVVHGLPGERVIQKGDLVSIDVGLEWQGLFTDAAFSLVVGRMDDKAERLLNACREALSAGIREARPGNRVGNISQAVQQTIEEAGYSVVRDFVGHGLGHSLHEEPQIPNFGRRGDGMLLKSGMVVAIEPMANEKGFQVKVLDDGWTVVTADGGLSAHFEHTVLIGPDSPEILTRSPRRDSLHQ
ncbi:MAG TPA: type I methionyl aminopeptidase [Atribacteraceae bacterium]|nr:type I methionyl aminopeptidase [Atribacteraceae bacterium]